jgi:hypothetical protein
MAIGAGSLVDVALGKLSEQGRADGAIGDLAAGGMKASGRHSASVSAWIFVVRPPRERLMA